MQKQRLEIPYHLGITSRLITRENAASVYHVYYLSSRCYQPGDKHPCRPWNPARWHERSSRSFSNATRTLVLLGVDSKGGLLLEPERGRLHGTGGNTPGDDRRWARPVKGEQGKSEGSHRESYPEQRRWDGMLRSTYFRCCSSRWPIFVGLSSKHEVRANFSDSLPFILSFAPVPPRRLIPPIGMILHHATRCPVKSSPRPARINFQGCSVLLSLEYCMARCTGCCSNRGTNWKGLGLLGFFALLIFL